MSTPGTNPATPTSDVKDPKQHTDGLPLPSGGVDVEAGAEVKRPTPDAKPGK